MECHLSPLLSTLCRSSVTPPSHARSRRRLCQSRLRVRELTFSAEETQFCLMQKREERREKGSVNRGGGGEGATRLSEMIKSDTPGESTNNKTSGNQCGLLSGHPR